MKSPRLLPVVIFAAVALLAFKGIGLITNGGYVLVGTTAAHAAEGEDSAPSADAAPRTEPTMSDSSPTLADTSPTAAAPAPAAAHGEEAAAAAPPEASTADAPAPPAAAPTTNAVAAANSIGAASDPAQPADASPMTTSMGGKTMALAEAAGTVPTDDTILQRLGERRAELDKREANLKLREAIVAAAEKQLAERGDALKALEAQIAALSQQKQSMEDSQFAGVVKLYENMKPQEAAAIFNGLDLPVLLRVAKAMDPRKMSPILAKMAATRAQELTMQLAAVDTSAVPTGSSVAAVDPNALPQIVGH